MKNDLRIMEEVEKTLNVYDEDTTLEPNPFLLTRLNAAKKNNEAGKKRIVRFGAALNPLLIFILLLINLVTVYYVFSKDKNVAREAQLVIEMKSEFQIEQTEMNF